MPVLAETDLETVLATIAAERPEVCVIDSVQTLHAPELTGAPGSVGQVREVASQIMRAAKSAGVAVLLVGHVTKEGALAGPRVLEHLVDCVLQFEGERERTYRTLRALKNRFGSTNETGVFEMRQGGLVEVLDPSARFVGEATGKPGSVVLAAMEGTRPLLVEVQALVSPSELVPPRRVCNGIDRNRLALVLAVLAAPRGRRHRHAGRLRQRRRRRPRGRARRGPGGRAGRRQRRARRRGASTGVASRWPASARSASRASCARSPTATGAPRRRRSSASGGWSARRPRRRCAMRCARRSASPPPRQPKLGASGPVAGEPNVQLRTDAEGREIVVLAFPYDVRIVEAARRIPGRRFDWDRREWWALADDWVGAHVADIVARFPELEPSDEAAAWLRGIGKRWIGSVGTARHDGRGWFVAAHAGG